MNSVSVVIPTLGGKQLLRTIEALNDGTKTPDEILICVPVGTNIEFEIPSNARVVLCEKRSQVSQRSLGFKLAQYEFVLQLDDDTCLSKNCLELLVNTLLSLDVNSAITPAILNRYTKDSIYHNEMLNSPIKNYIYNGRDGYKSGTITKSGVCLGPEYHPANERTVEIHWVAGCCVLHRRNNLILDDFYPYEGKAYSEDLIASYLYKEKGIVFYNISSAKVYTEPVESEDNSFTNLLLELRAKKYFLLLSDRGMLHFYFYAILRFFYVGTLSVLRRVFKKIK